MSFDRDVWWISFSAFFADLGYQAVIAGLPLFLVLTLGAPDWLFGLATALAYGGGAFIAYFGGRFGDRVGHKRVAVLGNSLIPLLSLTGLVASAPAAVVLFATGWWARNFRTPSRRVMLTQVATRAQESRAFGLLHALDVGGGTLSALFAFALVLVHVSFRTVFLLTLVPLGISTLCLVVVRARAQSGEAGAPAPEAAEPGETNHRYLYYGVIVATAL
jgi:MFS family permease